MRPGLKPQLPQPIPLPSILSCSPSCRCLSAMWKPQSVTLDPVHFQSGSGTVPFWSTRAHTPFLPTSNTHPFTDATQIRLKRRDRRTAIQAAILNSIRSIHFLSRQLGLVHHIHSTGSTQSQTHTDAALKLLQLRPAPSDCLIVQQRHREAVATRRKSKARIWRKCRSFDSVAKVDSWTGRWWCCCCYSYASRPSRSIGTAANGCLFVAAQARTTCRLLCW